MKLKQRFLNPLNKTSTIKRQSAQKELLIEQDARQDEEIL